MAGLDESTNGIANEGTTEGAAFPPLVKALATLLMLALLVWGARAGNDIEAVNWSAGALGFLSVVAVMILVCYFWILRSRTTITPTHIRQTWVWPKEVALADVAHVKLVAIPGLDWLIAPRVIVRARGRGVLVFHAADRALLQAFAVLSLGGVPLR